MTKNIIRIASQVVLVAVVFVASLAVGFRARSQNVGVTKLKPFTAHKRILHTPGTQRTPVVQPELYARRSDGSHVRKYEVTSPDGEKGWVVEIHDLRRNQSITLEPFTKSAMTFLYTNREMRDWIARNRNCASPQVAAVLGAPAVQMRDSMQGREVLRVVSEEADGERTEAWVQTDLNCFALQETVSRSSGALQQMTVTDLEEGEPPDSMFEIPVGYVESSPLQVEAAYQAKYPGHAFWGYEMARIVDERYVASRKK